MMLVSRIFVALAGMASLVAALPASAQAFLKPADLHGERVTGAEPGMTGPALPDATETELRAALVWNLRAALNVAALQCQFSPALQTPEKYNALLTDHSVELKSSYDTLQKYFTRMAKNNKKAGMDELDRFGTRVYSGFSTVSGQHSFCTTASSIGLDAIFLPRGKFGDLAEERMRELRTSLQAWGEQAFPHTVSEIGFQQRLPPFSDENCWNGSFYVEQRCGLPWWEN